MQYNNNLENDFLNRTVIRAAQILLIFMSPALLMSIYRAFTLDGALAVIAVQSLLYIVLIVASLPQLTLSYKTRVVIITVIAIVIGVAGFIRNQNIFMGFAYFWLGFIFFSILLAGLARYLIPSVGYALLVLYAVNAGYEGPVQGVAHLLGFTGITCASIYLLDAILQRSVDQRNEYAAIAEHLSEAKVELALLLESKDLQQARQDQVAKAANIAFLEYDYTTGLLDGDAQLQRRYGRSESDGPITLLERADSFPEESLALISGEILEMSLMPVGTERTFVHDQWIDGEIRTMRVTGANIEREDSLVFFGASIDITEEALALKQAHEFSDLIELVSNSGGIGLIEFFPDSRTFKCNAEVSNRLGLVHTDQERDIELFYAHQTEEIRALFLTPRQALAESDDGELQSFVHPFYLANSELHYMRVSRVKREVDGRTSFLGLSLDITDEVRAKEQAEQQAEQLQQASTKLMQEQDRQAQMYAVIGHELRTPTASLKMILDDAQQGNGQINTALFSSTIDQLLGVIDTLRTVAQPEKMSRASVNSVVLADLLNDQLQILTPIAKQSGVTLKGDFDSLASDRIDLKAQLLKQLVSNLTKNAIIHSKGSEVRIEAEAAVKDGVKSVILVVADNGVGIPAEQIQHLFSAFSRGSSDAEGTGLGLYVCREIATALGGNLTYEPGLEGGSRFVLRFDAKLSKLATDTDTEALRGLTVLLAEDNPTIQMLTKRMLEQKGAHPVVANNGEEALLKLQEQSFDLILSDIFMPKMNGYQFVEGLRQQGIDTPLIGLTAATIGEETDKMLAAGANAVLSKPVNIKELTKLVASFKS